MAIQQVNQTGTILTLRVVVFIGISRNPLTKLAVIGGFLFLHHQMLHPWVSIGLQKKAI